MQVVDKCSRTQLQFLFLSSHKVWKPLIEHAITEYKSGLTRCYPTSTLKCFCNRRVKYQGTDNCSSIVKTETFLEAFWFCLSFNLRNVSPFRTITTTVMTLIYFEVIYSIMNWCSLTNLKKRFHFVLRHVNLNKKTCIVVKHH